MSEVLTPNEYHIIAAMNREAFEASDEFSKPENIKRLAGLSGGDIGVLRDSRNSDILLGYYLAQKVKGVSYLLRYAVLPAYKGRGLAKKVLAKFWHNHTYATTYVSTANAASFHALLASGFRYLCTDANYIQMIGVKT